MCGHDDEGDQDAQWQRDDGDHAAPDVEQERDAYEAHDQQLLAEADAQARYRPLDQRSAVVGDLDLDTVGQARLGGLELGLDGADDLERAFAVPHHDDAADGLALAVPLGDAAAHFRPDADFGDVLEQDGSARGIDAQGDRADVVQGLDQPLPTDHEFLLGDLEQASAHVAVA